MSGAYRTADSTAPGRGAVVITPSAVTVIPCTRAVYVGGAGDLQVVMIDGQTATFAGLTAGTLLPIQVVQVLTGTSATNLLAIY